MRSLPQRHLALVFAVLLLCGWSQAARQMVVQKISVKAAGNTADDPLQVDVRTSTPTTPEAQVIDNPERLVIDVPGAIPAVSLRNQSVNRRDVERVRVALFSSAPPVTRIVLDLNAPQPYRIAPTASGFEVTVGAASQSATSQNPAESSKSVSGEPPASEPIIGWVSAGATSTSVAARPDPFVVKGKSAEPAKPVLVQYANGQLEIHAHDAPLYDVLAMIHQQTGAEITIPPFTRDEHVVGDFGPASASEVLAQLLNGTNMNFVVVASPTDPNALRNVVLSLRPEGGAEYIPHDNSAQAVNPAPSDNNEAPAPVVEPRPEDIPQSQPPDAPAPPQDTPQN
jgi:AMIN domain